MKKKISLFLLFIITFSIALTNYFPNSYASADIPVYSSNYIVIESTTGKVVCEENADEVLYPASTTKIMTAILTLENCNLTDTATVSHEAIYTVPVGYSHAMLVEGEILTVEQLLNVLLIPSANDAANVLAEHIAGSVDSFSTMMNTKAKELGCTNTNFVNPNGIHDDNHYTTVRDMAIMAKYAMENETFRKIVTTTRYTLPATNKYPEADRYFKNTNELILKDDRDSVDNYYYPYAIGVKTGFTNPAGECLVAAARKDDKEYIAVFLGSGRTENGLSARFIDSKNLFEYAFDNYKTYTINEENALLKEVEISNASIFNKNLDVVIQDKITLLVKNNENVSSLTPTIEYSSDLKAPIKKNTVIGTITYNVDGNTYTSNLISGEDIQESNLFNTILILGSIIVILYLLYKLMKIKKSSKKKKKKSKKQRDNYLYW